MSSTVIKPFEDELKDSSPYRIAIYSLVFHILVIIVAPILTKLVWKEKEFIRPQTFQLVTMQQPTPVKKKSAPVKKQKKVKKKTVAKKESVKTKKTPTPAKKEKVVEKTIEDVEVFEEDLDELEELLGTMPKPLSSISVGKQFKYQWYLNNIRSKVERNWKPPFNDNKKSVRLQFTIFTSGKISGVRVTGSSGNKAVDNLGIRAVKLASPFGKLPAGFTGKSLEIEYTLWLHAK